MSVYSSTDKPHKSLWKKKIMSSFLKVILWQCTPLDLVARRGSEVSCIWVAVCLDGSDTSPVAAVWPMTHKAQEMIFLSVNWPPQDTKFSGRNDKTLICWNWRSKYKTTRSEQELEVSRVIWGHLMHSTDMINNYK